MALKEIVSCDECGVQKGAVNHWVMVAPVKLFDLPNAVTVDEGGKDAVLILPWNDRFVAEKGVMHYCGAEHALKKVSEFLGAQR